jgi:hypothetical protein
MNANVQLQLNGNDDDLLASVALYLIHDVSEAMKSTDPHEALKRFRWMQNGDALERTLVVRGNTGNISVLFF